MEYIFIAYLIADNARDFDVGCVVGVERLTVVIAGGSMKNVLALFVAGLALGAVIRFFRWPDASSTQLPEGLRAEQPVAVGHDNW